MGTTPRGIVFPEPSGVPSRQALEDLATSTDDALDALLDALFGPGVRPRIEYGSVTVTCTSAGAGSAAVTFDEPFVSTPKIICNVSSGAGPTDMYAHAHSRSSSGFHAAIVQRDNSSVTRTLNVDWIAIGA